jgi:hypothetical protein
VISTLATDRARNRGEGLTATGAAMALKGASSRLGP